jgi:hypothetical protein
LCSSEKPIEGVEGIEDVPKKDIALPLPSNNEKTMTKHLIKIA